MQLLCTEVNGKVPKYFTHPSIFRCGYPHLYKPLLVVVVVGEAQRDLIDKTEARAQNPSRQGPAASKMPMPET